MFIKCLLHTDAQKLQKKKFPVLFLPLTKMLYNTIKEQLRRQAAHFIMLYLYLYIFMLC